MRRLFLLIVIVGTVSLFSVTAAVDPFSLPIGTVIIDAGHGGHDPGATKRWSFHQGEILEKDLNLDIAKRLAVLLKLDHPDLTIVMTREDDRYLSLAERSKIAYSQPLLGKSALFISIHVNSATSEAANGFEILIKFQDKRVTLIDEHTPTANIALFAAHSQASLNRLLNNRNLVVASVFEKTMSQRLVTARSRGIKEQDLWVLNQSRMPSVLVEVGFLTNEADAKRLLSSQYRQTLAEVLCDAIERLL
ncbi:MAG: N-acetylmuramoyl-L-alanine amidase [Sphaerochaeta sp.]|jgi:N-acetylmuramoyl-L-alanine amidase